MKKFQRTIEDFVCENCGRQVNGNGYTNHCPFCLWSKHVDVNPGDRMNDCRGKMKPVNVYFKSQKWYLSQKCQKCGAVRMIKLKEKDNLEIVYKIINEKQRIV